MLTANLKYSNKNQALCLVGKMLVSKMSGNPIHLLCWSDQLLWKLDFKADGWPPMTRTIDTSLSTLALCKYFVHLKYRWAKYGVDFSQIEKIRLEYLLLHIHLMLFSHSSNLEGTQQSALLGRSLIKFLGDTMIPHFRETLRKLWSKLTWQTAPNHYIDVGSDGAPCQVSFERSKFLLLWISEAVGISVHCVYFLSNDILKHSWNIHNCTFRQGPDIKIL